MTKYVSLRHFNLWLNIKREFQACIYKFQSCYLTLSFQVMVRWDCQGNEWRQKKMIRVWTRDPSNRWQETNKLVLELPVSTKRWTKQSEKSALLIFLMPSVRVPKTERIRCPQQCKSIKGFTASSSQGSRHVQHSGVEQEPRARFTAGFISLERRQGVGKGWLAAEVSWYLLIGQSSSLWLARVIVSLIGQSYHLSCWPELPSPEAPEAWLRDYFWPSAPLWACHGSGEVVTKSPK